MSSANKLTASLAFDIGSKLMETEEILEKYGLSKRELARIIKTPEFQTLYKEAKVAWESDIDQRLELKASMALEENLLTLHQIAGDPDTDAADRIRAVQLLATVGGKTVRKGEGGVQGGSAGRVNININIPPAPGVPQAQPSVISVEAQPLPDGGVIPVEGSDDAD